MTNMTNDFTYRTKEDAILDGIPANEVVHTADEFFCAEDDTVSCAGCDAVYAERSELDDDLNCETCAGEAVDHARDLQGLNADWSASRGCNMGRAGW